VVKSTDSTFAYLRLRFAPIRGKLRSYKFVGVTKTAGVCLSEVSRLHQKLSKFDLKSGRNTR
jgi:hypothetical protein